jgi:diaminopropionate ammonia-lyase
MAALVGLQATIYIPASMRAARPEAIAGEGADPDGSSAVARWVIDGYSTLFAELDAQLPAAAAIDTVLLQTGVGAFAAAGVR